MHENTQVQQIRNELLPRWVSFETQAVEVVVVAACGQRQVVCHVVPGLARDLLVRGATMPALPHHMVHELLG